MIFSYAPNGTALECQSPGPDAGPPDNAVWIDLVSPTPEEDRLVERALGIAVPTREEMQEIEVSSRLYTEDGARYMTATLLCQSDSESPKTTPITFILAGRRLVTVRHDAPLPFAIVAAKLSRSCPAAVTGEAVLMELLDAVIDRAADILERTSAEVDTISRQVFEPTPSRSSRSRTYAQVLRSIGRADNLNSNVRESLVSIGRLVLFLANESDGLKWPKDMRAQLKVMQRDVTSLADHVSYLSSKVTFMLDAVVGLVSIEQNNIIKIFSVAAVALLPPTLIASIYGMNFKAMPELDWAYGYPFALGLMVLSALLPFLYFKWRGWL